MLCVIVFGLTYEWLPSTLVGMTFMNMPVLSALTGNDSFCEFFGVDASLYFDPELESALFFRAQPKTVLSAQQIAS